MKRASYISVLLCAAFAARAQTHIACRPLMSDQILGRDVAAAVPQLAFLPSELKLGYSPAPGVERAFSAAQLQQLAKRYEIEAKIAQPVCFGWALHALTKEEITAAIRKSLDGQQVEIEVSDNSRSLVPDGELSFPLQGLSARSDKAATWNGVVIYGGGRRFNTWASVRVTVHETHLIAMHELVAGEVIDASSLKEIDYKGPLVRLNVLQRMSEVSGKSARWSLAPGTVLTSNMLVPPLDVAKEELVTVHINSGAAHIETQGLASDAGYVGNVIRVRNPKTGRVFRARIDDRGMVTVVPGGSVGLVVEDKKS